MSFSQKTICASFVYHCKNNNCNLQKGKCFYKFIMVENLICQMLMQIKMSRNLIWWLYCTEGIDLKLGAKNVGNVHSECAKCLNFLLQRWRAVPGIHWRCFHLSWPPILYCTNSVLLQLWVLLMPQFLLCHCHYHINSLLMWSKLYFNSTFAAKQLISEGTANPKSEDKAC